MYNDTQISPTGAGENSFSKVILVSHVSRQSNWCIDVLHIPFHEKICPNDLRSIGVKGIISHWDIAIFVVTSSFCGKMH